MKGVMTNWKTTLFGVLMTVGAAVGSGQFGAPSATVSKAATLLQLAGGAGLAFSAKDKDVTGGSKGNKTGEKVEDNK